MQVFSLKWIGNFLFFSLIKSWFPILFQIMYLCCIFGFIIHRIRRCLSQYSIWENSKTFLISWTHFFNILSISIRNNGIFKRNSKKIFINIWRCTSPFVSLPPNYHCQRFLHALPFIIKVDLHWFWFIVINPQGASIRSKMLYRYLNF